MTGEREFYTPPPGAEQNLVGNLRREIAALKCRLERKEKRIEELLEEKYGLEDLLQRKSAKVLEQRGPQRVGDGHGGGGEEPAKMARKLEREKRRPGGFTVSTDAGKMEELPDLPELKVWTRELSDIRPEVLGYAAWVVSEVSEEERTGYRKYNKEQVEEEDGEVMRNDKDGQVDTPTSPDAQRRLKRRRVDSVAPTPTRDRHPSTTASTDGVAVGPHDRCPGRSNYRGPSHRRKAVCVHCWNTRQLCDFDPQCTACRRAGVRCVRKLCQDREWCGNERCPCLHPGEWDERDGGFVVEQGRLPRS